MPIFHPLKTCGLAALLGAVSPILNADERPNFLYIAIDDLNAYVGCLGGHPQAKTPNIDRLAQSGVVFTNAHCQAPICGPSRASIHAGLLPSTTGIYLQISDGDLREASEATRAVTFLPDYLEQHGYRTVGCGKIFHQGDKGNFFDEFGHGSNMGPKPKKRISYDPAWFEDREGKTQTDWGAYPSKDESMPDHKTADWVIDRLKSMSKKPSGERKPFFLAAGFVRPHVPWTVPQKWFDLHDPGKITKPAYLAEDLEDVPEISLRVNEAPMMPAMDWVLKQDRWTRILQAYLASTTFVDHQVGRILDALQASPFADNTHVILWSDHGYHVGEKGRFAKQSLWRESSRVPLVFAGKGVTRGGVCDRPVQLLDLYPTILDLAKLPPNASNEGHSLMPLLMNPEAEWKHVALTTYGRNNHAVEDGRYRYIRYEDGAEELYDHEQDPHEWRNLAKDPETAPIRQRLAGHLPAKNVPRSKASRYDFNDYFRKQMSDDRSVPQGPRK